MRSGPELPRANSDTPPEAADDTITGISEDAAGMAVQDRILASAHMRRQKADETMKKTTYIFSAMTGAVLLVSACNPEMMDSGIGAVASGLSGGAGTTSTAVGLLGASSDSPSSTQEQLNQTYMGILQNPYIDSEDLTIATGLYAAATIPGPGH